MLLGFTLTGPGSWLISCSFLKRFVAALFLAVAEAAALVSGLPERTRTRRTASGVAACCWLFDRHLGDRFTIQSKFVLADRFRSASGAGFMKSMA